MKLRLGSYLLSLVLHHLIITYFKGKLCCTCITNPYLSPALVDNYCQAELPYTSSSYLNIAATNVYQFEPLLNTYCTKYVGMCV